MSSHWIVDIEAQQQEANVSNRTLLRNVTNAEQNGSAQQISETIGASTPNKAPENGTTTNASVELGQQSHFPQQIELTQNPWNLLAQFVVGGLVAGAALFGANMLLDKVRKPNLSLEWMGRPSF
jgi:hypothetical protein